MVLSDIIIGPTPRKSIIIVQARQAQVLLSIVTRAATAVSAVVGLSCGLQRPCIIQDANRRVRCFGKITNMPAELAQACLVGQAGEEHQCAISAYEGRLHCWGPNTFGQVSVPPVGQTWAPWLVSPPALGTAARSPAACAAGDRTHSSRPPRMRTRPRTPTLRILRRTAI